MKEIPLNKLFHSAHNVRKTVNETKKVDEDLVSSIKRYGLIQNLTVIETGSDNYEVIAGGRRLSALNKLAEDNLIENTHLVPCNIVEKEDAVAISLSENVMREDMSPVDEFRAYKKMKDDGQTEESIALAFNVSKRKVKQRLALADVDEVVLQGFEEGYINLETLSCFCLTKDKNRQRQCYEAIKDMSYCNPHNLKKALTNESFEKDSPVVKFVGISNYKKAGGAIESDLFSAEQWYSGETIMSLANEKTHEIESKLSTLNYSWLELELNQSYSYLISIHNDEKKESVETQIIDRLEELSKIEKTEYEIDEYNQLMLESVLQEDVSDEIKKYSGIRVTLKQNGCLEIQTSLFKENDYKAYQKAIAEGDNGNGQPQENEGNSSLSMALKDELECHNQQLTQLTGLISGDDTIRLFHFECCYTFYRNMQFGYAHKDNEISISFTGMNDDIYTQTPAGIAIEDKKNELDLSWVVEDKELAYEAYCGLDNSIKRDLLIYCISMSYSRNANMINQVGNKVAACEYFRPTPENLWNRLKKEQLLAEATDIFGEEWAEQHNGLSKKELVNKINTLFKGSYDSLNEHQISNIINYEPPIIRK